MRVYNPFVSKKFTRRSFQPNLDLHIWSLISYTSCPIHLKLGMLLLDYPWRVKPLRTILKLMVIESEKLNKIKISLNSLLLIIFKKSRNSSYNIDLAYLVIKFFNCIATQ